MQSVQRLTGRGVEGRWRRMREGAGFTLVELMAVIVITVIGFLAMLHLQAGVLRANTTARDVVTATQLALHLIETIRLEALEWTNDTTQGVDQAKFQYLRHVNDEAGPVAGRGSGWRRAYDIQGATFRMVNALGRDATYDAGALQQFPDTQARRFCARYRLTWLIPNFLIRVETRVLWPRAEGQGGLYDACGPNMDTDVANAYQVTQVTTIMKNVFVTP